jgi:ABC-2 type transport system ATP-binding protein
MSATPVIEVRNLVVEYGKGAKKHRAVNDVTFEVREGETVGFIGVNGAGKSTTMKAMMGFLFPTSGEVRIFGRIAGDAESRRRIGYLPEVALYYPFMKARELLELYGGLHGIPGAELKRRIPPLLDEVGLSGKGEQLLRQFSKGMQQRLGIAQAIISRPEALIFDELSSGLDPAGRFDLREVLLRLKREGRTIFFSSHELSEVETLCDRVIIIHRGKLIAQATVEELMKPLNRFVIEFAMADGAPVPQGVAAHSPERHGEHLAVTITGVSQYAAALAALAEAKARILSTTAETRSIEQYFIDLVRAQEGPVR